MYQLKEKYAKPSFEPVGKQTFERLYMGVELEFESNPYNAQALMDKTDVLFRNFAILKQDASLHNGFEICSRPASLDSHKEQWQEFFERVAPFLIVSERCGMHVHINRAPLSGLQIGKMVAFIHNKENYNFIKIIAGRESNQYCHYDFPRAIKEAKPEYYRLLSKKVGVNLLHNETVEIRIFKSTVNIKTFFKNLEFCDALVRFTFPAHSKINDSTQYQAFVKFVYENPEQYPNLIKSIY